MLFADCCLFVGVRGLLFALAIWCLLSVACNVLFVAWWLLLVVCCSSCDVRCLVIGCALFVVCCFVCAVCRVLLVV